MVSRVDGRNGVADHADHRCIRSVRQRRSAIRVFVNGLPLSKLDSICGVRKDQDKDIKLTMFRVHAPVRTVQIRI